MEDRDGRGSTHGKRRAHGHGGQWNREKWVGLPCLPCHVNFPKVETRFYASPSRLCHLTPSVPDWMTVAAERQRPFFAFHSTRSCRRLAFPILFSSVQFYIYTSDSAQLVGSFVGSLVLSFVHASVARLLLLMLLLPVLLMVNSVCRSRSKVRARSTPNSIFLSFAFARVLKAHSPE